MSNAQTSRVLITDLAAMKVAGKKWAMLTCYEQMTAQIFDEADVLTGITINDQEVTLSSASFDLVKNKPVIFAGPSANADAFISQITNAIGERVDITFSFAKASPVKLNALILQNDGIYTDLLRYKTDTAAKTS